MEWWRTPGELKNRRGREEDRRQGGEKEVVEGIEEKRQEYGEEGGRRTGKRGGRREEREKRKGKCGRGAWKKCGGVGRSGWATEDLHNCKMYVSLLFGMAHSLVHRLRLGHLTVTLWLLSKVSLIKQIWGVPIPY